MNKVAPFILTFTTLLVPCLKSQNLFHGTITRYEDSQRLWNHVENKFVYKGCNAEQFILYSRHASRYPGKKITKLVEIHLSKIKEKILANPLLKRSFKDRFRFWHSQYKESNCHKLSATGEKEMYALGERYRTRFPNLLGPPFSHDSQEYRHTDKQRTTMSARMFALGALGKHDFKENFESLPVKAWDPLLRFYKNCTKWKKEIDDSVIAHEEEKKFLNSAAYLSAMKRISDRILPPGSENLNHDQIKAIYSACIFDHVINQNRSSPWCLLFSSQDLKIMEFWEDIEHYWTDGYAFPLTYQQACPPFTDIIQNLRDVTNGRNHKRAVLRFSHLGLMLKIFARFGLFNDGIDLTHDMLNIKIMSDKFDVDRRKYRMSKIGPMASNLALVLYKCGIQYKIKIFVQEHEVTLYGCDSSFCDLKQFLSKYETIADSCNVDEICKI